MAELYRLMAKLAQGERLSTNEMQELEFEFKAVDEAKQIVKLWSPHASKNSQPVFTEEKMPIWEASPLYAFTFVRLANLTVTTATDTYVEFDTWTNDNPIFARDPADGEKVLVRGAGRSWKIFGYVNWAANAAGYTKMHVEGYTADDTLIGGTALYTAANHNLVDQVIPLNYGSAWQQFPSLSYLKFFVHQTSGGDQVLKDVVMNIALE